MTAIRAEVSLLLAVGRLASASALTEDIANSPDWITVPYKCNRGIIYDGDLPHMSTPIICIRQAQSTCLEVSHGIDTGISAEEGITKNSITDITKNTIKNTAVNSIEDSTGNFSVYSAKDSTKTGAINGDINSTKNSIKGVEAGRGESESKREGTPGTMRRVILGFNCFPQKVDECCSRAPEHSGECPSHIVTLSPITNVSCSCFEIV